MAKPNDDPWLVEAELLGSMMRSPDAVHEVTEIVSADDFWSDAHRRVFAAIVALSERGVQADAVAVAEELNTLGHVEDVGGYAYIAKLWDEAATGANARHGARLVQARSLWRRLGDFGRRVVQEVEHHTSPVSEALETAEKELFAIAERLESADVATTTETMNETFDLVDGWHAEGGPGMGIKTGLIDLDEKTSGLQAGELIIIGARPSNGKTALGLQVARTAAKNTGRPVFFVSLEMAKGLLGLRLACTAAGLDSHKARRGCFGPEDFRRFIDEGNKLKGEKLLISDRGGQSVPQIAAAARRLKRQQDICAVFIDYIGLVKPDNPRDARHLQLGAMTRRLKCLAKDLDIPVVVLAQLNREVEGRVDREPKLSDLRESGDLEQDADVVLLLHRPAQQPGVIKVNVAKNRNGPTGSVKLTWRPEFTRFENYAPGMPPFGGG
jgi:replicative DNA helicase